VFSYSVANVDQMEGTGNAYIDELSGNGLFSLAAAMRRNELDYDRFYRVMPQAEADGLLRHLHPERTPMPRARQVSLSDMHVRESRQALPSALLAHRPRNVVLVSVESLSASFLGAYGATGGLTPNLDRIARQGWQFNRVFATGTRTVRGLEALSIGTPPVPGQSIVRRPKNEHLATIGELLKDQGFVTQFIYGGYGYFDNMNAYFSGNDYKIVDRTDFPDQSIVFENAWGVADESLFDNALNAIDHEVKTGKRVFTHIMTTSNHRPYTYPNGRIDIPSPGKRPGAVKYTDYAIGKFLEDARAKPWFNDTLFVFIADHCASVAGKTRLPVEKYHIPLIMYAPALLRPAIFDQTLSQIDVVPTLLDMLGADGRDAFFGTSVFRQTPAEGRAFISNYQELGYLKHGILTVLSPKQMTRAFRVDPATFETTPTTVDDQLLKEAIAYYQTASRAFKVGDLSMAHYRMTHP
jgi:phosphoglycerol transferase MdoB-like AlkP superfamily enzyme